MKKKIVKSMLTNRISPRQLLRLEHNLKSLNFLKRHYVLQLK